ncbi:MAG: pyridoxal phosphate-dependent aminotransferase [candidate division KSB1 bacterium]
MTRKLFSSRFTFSLATNRLGGILERKRAQREHILDLTESNPTRAGLVYDEAEILAALSQPQTLRYEPEPRGLFSARQAVAAYYRARGEQVTAEHIHLTASTSEGYAYLFKLLADPEAEVLVPQPAYPLLDFLTALESVRLVHYPLCYEAAHGWRIDLEQLALTISTKTVAIVLVNPNNPTGSFIKQEELRELNTICAEHNLALICDEVFSDYGEGEDEQRVPSLVGNDETLTFVLSGLSKVSALPQMKLGWIHVSGPAALREEAQERLDFIADTYLSVSTPVQHAAKRLLAQRDSLQAQIQARCRANETWLRAECARLPNCHMLKREGGWYAIIEMRLPFDEEEFTVRLLEAENVLLHPGYFFDFPKSGFLVVSLLTPEEIFQRGVAALCTMAAAC